MWATEFGILFSTDLLAGSGLGCLSDRLYGGGGRLGCVRCAALASGLGLGDGFFGGVDGGDLGVTRCGLERG